MRKRKPSKNTERKTLGVEELDDLMPPLAEDHPLYTQGWVVGQTFRGWSPAEARKWSEMMAGFSERPTMTEEEIQAELQRMRDAGYGTVELSFAESVMRGLDGKPKGSA